MGASIKMGGGGGRRGRRAKHAPMHEINVTPFVDVMLVLLIIFMVAAPLMANGIPIDLPRTGAKAIDQPKKEPLLISVKREGLFIDDEKTATPLADLAGRIKAAKREKDDVFYIRGARDVEYEKVAQVITEVMAAGFHKFVLRTSPENGG